MHVRVQDAVPIDHKGRKLETRFPLSADPLPRLSANVVLLSITSFLADVSGEMVLVILPLELLGQGATGLALGLVGAAEAVQHFIKPVAGWLADRTTKRKPLIFAGYVAPPAARVGIALATTPWLVALFRGADRAGKGLRTSPRDALLAESAPPEQRGRAFGIHRAADTAGAFLGVAIAFALVTWLAWSPRSVILLAAALGLLTVIPILLVREIEADSTKSKRTFEAASPRYRAYLLVAGVFALGNLAVLFILARAATSVGAGGAILLYLLYNLVYLAGAYPAGVLADRIGKPRVLAVGFAITGAGFAVLSFAPTLASAVVAFAVLGLGVASVDGVERAFAADLAGSAGRSTRLGLFQMVVGIAGVAGGITAGGLWDWRGPGSAFVFGATASAVALGLMVVMGFLRGESRAPPAGNTR